MRTKLASWVGALCVATFAPQAASGPAEADWNRYDVELLGGFAGLTGSWSEVTDAGPAFGAQVEIAATRVFDVEVSYIAASFPIADSRILEASIWSHSLAGVVRISIPYARTVEPFIGAGAGLGWMRPTAGATDLFEPDWVVQLPLAAGIEFDAGVIEAGIRGGWTALFLENVTTEYPRGGGILSASLTLGVEL